MFDDDCVVSYVTEEQATEIIRRKANENSVLMEEALASENPATIVKAMYYKGFNEGVVWCLGMFKECEVVE